MSRLDTPLSAPVDLSFRSPSNLKEAIDWILRVTGKDGGHSDDKSEALAQAIVGLPGFNEAISAAAAKLKESGGDGSEALGKLQNTNTLKSIIEKLANGLGTFIGYNNGTIKHGSGGIGLPNDPRERLGDAVLGFLAGMLENLERTSQISKIKLTNVDVKNILKALGEGIYAFYEAIEKVQNLNDSSTKITEVVKQLNGINGILNGLPTIRSSVTLVQLTTEVSKYLKAVLEAVKEKVSGQVGSTQADSKVGYLSTKLTCLVSDIGSKWKSGPIDLSAIKDGIDALLDAQKGLSDKLRNTGSSSDNTARCLISAIISGTSQFLSQLKKAHYASYYQGVMVETNGWSGAKSADAKTCAKIFLGCLPMVFSALSYLYWRCHENGGGWNDMKLRDDGKADDLKDFLYSMAYGPSILSAGKTGGVVSKALQKFEDFKACMQKTKKSYPDFLKDLKKSGREQLYKESLSSSTDYSLSTLHAIAKLYFTGKQIRGADQTKTSPSTISEMLYFLAALPFSPELGGCEKYINNLLSKPLPIYFAGLKTETPLPLTADSINNNLTSTTCLFATIMLGRFQGPKTDDDPFLHNLYSNGMSLHYPSGAPLFRKVAECVYAVQFQMMFLLQQCSGKYSETCGWRDCRFGKKIEPKNSSSTFVLSHICRGYTCEHTKRLQCPHNGSATASNSCVHNTSNSAKCGSGSTDLSPLQAFLTDKLKGFRIAPQLAPDSTNHLHNHPPGSMCHVPMGFRSTDLRDSMASKGAHISVTLRYICANIGSPFRRIYENLLCLTKRTPRTLGELFGFYWQFIVLLNHDASKKNKQYFSYAFLMASLRNSKATTVLIRDLSNMNASKESHGVYHPADLLSLYYPKCSGVSCGPYLFPLVYTTGATFSPNYAYTYLSWLVYLADDFRDWMSEFLEGFDGLKCEGCGHSCGHPSGSHDSGCNCPTITQCADVLPLFYEYGFTMLDASRLNGWKWDQTKGQWQSDTSTKRSCNAFHSALSTVISGTPLNKFLESIDDFLYAIRWIFFSKLSAFWTIYLCLILYTFFFLLDTLRLRSHLKLTSSHTVPPLALLTSGKPILTTKLTYITQ
ncbi:variant erythrocyte surface antigen-1 family protein [Babesia caballi]|uniref:Variant erythrocyte surface antigen-1 family protein n=1 Tax=Babesia caballi TaxID=5871 RepID=A0AAV4LT13_BABCB|nr:variant erythrocyte surface antigen-1 family protein [Babesia caballi]